MDKPQLNLAEVAACYGGNPKVLVKTLQRVRDNLPKQWFQLLDVIDKCDAQQIDVSAHKMAGTAMMAGAERLALNLKEMSHYSRDGEIPSPQMVSVSLGLYESLLDELDIVLARLETD